MATRDGERSRKKISIKRDYASIRKGKKLFDEHCLSCHDPHSTAVIEGPGLIGVLKKPKLPVSKRPATPENIADQLINPYDEMPTFSDLTKEEIENIIAYLNTL